MTIVLDTVAYSLLVCAMSCARLLQTHIYAEPEDVPAIKAGIWVFYCVGFATHIVAGVWP